MARGTIFFDAILLILNKPPIKLSNRIKEFWCRQHLGRYAADAMFSAEILERQAWECVSLYAMYCRDFMVI